MVELDASSCFANSPVGSSALPDGVNIPTKQPSERTEIPRCFSISLFQRKWTLVAQKRIPEPLAAR